MSIGTGTPFIFTFISILTEKKFSATMGSEIDVEFIFSILLSNCAPFSAIPANPFTILFGVPSGSTDTISGAYNSSTAC